MRNLFLLWSKNLHPACIIYRGIYVCKENHSGETKQNVEMRWEDHLGIKKISEPSNNLKTNSMHTFQ